MDLKYLSTCDSLPHEQRYYCKNTIEFARAQVSLTYQLLTIPLLMQLLNKLVTNLYRTKEP